MSIETRIIRLEDRRPSNASPIVWREPGEPEAAAIARYCADRGLEKLPCGVVPQFVSWLASD
jgi:hypothetical protein